LILAIDQAEELFLAEGQDEAHKFLVLLRDLLVEDAPAVAALFTIRSDNYEHLQLAKELEGVKQATLSLPSMPQGAYAEVIKGPAKRLDGTSRALKIEDALVQALLTDIEAGGAKDALPLLAFTLERLYDEYQAGGELKQEQYDQLGGIAGSIEAAVEQAFKEADRNPAIPRDRQTRLALLRRGLIPWVAGIDPDTGAARRRVARMSEMPSEARPLMDLLVDQRLLSTDVAKDTGEKTVEPAHEALLRQWGLLQGWLREDSGLLGVMDGVKRASRDWAAAARSSTWLTHRTDRLKAAERLLERADLAANLGPSDREYLAACRKVQREFAPVVLPLLSILAFTISGMLTLGVTYFLLNTNEVPWQGSVAFLAMGAAMTCALGLWRYAEVGVWRAVLIGTGMLLIAVAVCLPVHAALLANDFSANFAKYMDGLIEAIIIATAMTIFAPALRSVLAWVSILGAYTLTVYLIDVGNGLWYLPGKFLAAAIIGAHFRWADIESPNHRKALAALRMGILALAGLATVSAWAEAAATIAYRGVPPTWWWFVTGGLVLWIAAVGYWLTQGRSSGGRPWRDKGDNAPLAKSAPSRASP
jgi:hypothetical protein